MKNPPWLKDEIILVMDFYIDNSAKIPGKDSDEIAELSSLLNDFRNMHGLHGDAKFRNVNGVYMKIMNLRVLYSAAVDSIGVAGFSVAPQIGKFVLILVASAVIGFGTALGCALTLKFAPLSTTAQVYSLVKTDILGDACSKPSSTNPITLI